jgi:hypothetical protein
MMPRLIWAHASGIPCMTYAITHPKGHIAMTEALHGPHRASQMPGLLFVCPAFQITQDHHATVTVRQSLNLFVDQSLETVILVAGFHTLRP